MKKTKLIGCIIIVLIICLIIVMLFIANLTVLKKDDIITKNNIDYNTKENVNNNVNENVTTEEENTNSVLENKDHIPASVDDFSFDIKGVTEEMSKHIKNMDEFNKSIKEFIYKYGLFDATSADVEKYEYQESTDRLGIIFKLNDPVGNRLRVIVNSDNKIDILLYE